MIENLLFSRELAAAIWQPKGAISSANYVKLRSKLRSPKKLLNVQPGAARIAPNSIEKSLY
jgi:hypothetical protein